MEAPLSSLSICWLSAEGGVGGDEVNNTVSNTCRIICVMYYYYYILILFERANGNLNLNVLFLGGAASETGWSL